MYPTFQYFLQAYCTLSLYEEEMWNIIGEFKQNENDTAKNQLLDELQSIWRADKWQLTVKWIRDYGNREFTIDQAKDWISFMIDALQKGK